MKNVLLCASFLLVIGGACKHADTTVNPVVDQRDQRVGLYSCEVKLKNFKTQEVFSTYLDTLEISKQGDKQLLVRSKKGGQLPVLELIDLTGHAFVGIATVLTFREGQSIQTDGGELIMNSGLDPKFYEYKGNKIR